MLTVAAIVTRMLVSESCGWWLGNGLFLVAKSSCFGCGIAFFWLRNRLIFGCGIGSFLVAEAPFFGCGSVSDFGCGIAEIWLRKRRNMAAQLSESFLTKHDVSKPVTELGMNPGSQHKLLKLRIRS